jgi:hypothetical protein
LCGAWFTFNGPIASIGVAPATMLPIVALPLIPSHTAPRTSCVSNKGIKVSVQSVQCSISREGRGISLARVRRHHYPLVVIASRFSELNCSITRARAKLRERRRPEIQASKQNELNPAGLHAGGGHHRCGRPKAPIGTMSSCFVPALEEEAGSRGMCESAVAGYASEDQSAYPDGSSSPQGAPTSIQARSCN